MSLRSLWNHLLTHRSASDLPSQSRAPQPPAESQPSPILGPVPSQISVPSTGRTRRGSSFRRTKTSSPVKRKESPDARPPSPSPDPSDTSSRTSSTRPRRSKRSRGWYYVRSPSPRPIFVPTVQGKLPLDRRPPPLPVALPSPDVWVFAGTEEIEGKKRKLAKHRPRRKLPEMAALEWSGSEGECEEEYAPTERSSL